MVANARMVLGTEISRNVALKRSIETFLMASEPQSRLLHLPKNGLEYQMIFRSYGDVRRCRPLPMPPWSSMVPSGWCFRQCLGSVVTMGRSLDRLGLLLKKRR